MFIINKIKNYVLYIIEGPLSSWLYRKYGCRFVVTLGALIASLGLLLSYFATNIWFLYISYGFISGFGFGFIYAPALAVLPDYFEKYRYFATSFATVGSAVGTLVMPQVLLYLIEAYTWRGAMLVVCGLMLQTVVFGLLLKSRSVNQQQQRFWTFEGMLFRDVRFYILCLDSFCFAGCSYIVYTMINAIVVERSLTIELSAVLASIIGFSNITGRIMSSFISQYKQTNRQLFFACVSFLCCVSSFLIVFCVHFWSFAICLTVFGLSYGMRISQVSGVLIDTFGVDKLVGTIGYYFFAGGIGALVIPPLAGKCSYYVLCLNTTKLCSISSTATVFCHSQKQM